MGTVVPIKPVAAAAGVPVTLTPGQFAKTAAAQKGSYGSYLKYVTNARARQSAPGGANDALAPRTPGEINSIVSGIVNKIVANKGLFQPRTDAQIQSEASGYVQPQIDAQINAITDEANARASRGMAAIGSLGTQLQAAQGGAGDDAMHNALMAAAARAAIGQSLGQSATAEGAQGAADIRAKLAAAGNGGVSDVYAQNAGGLGAGIGTTIGTHAATGAADTINRGESLSARDAALPGITALAGIRSGRMLQEQTNAGVKDNVGRLEATVPGLVSGIFQTLKGRDLATRQARANIDSQAAQLGGNLASHLGDQEVQKATARQGFGLDTTKLGLQAGEFDQSNQTKINIAKDKAAAAGQAVDAKTAKAAQSAVVKANSVAIAYLNKHVKPTPIYSEVLDTSTTPATKKQVVTGYKGYPSYYDMIHGIESQIAPIIGPYATQADVIRVSQRLVNADPHYKPGMNGRPGTSAPVAPSPTAGSHGAAP